MRKNIIVFAAGVVSGALGMKFAPKFISSLKRDDDAVDEILDEFDELVDEFDDLVVDSTPVPTEEPKAEPTEEPKAEPTEEPKAATPSPENGEDNKGGESND